jgi:hypothetical protein
MKGSGSTGTIMVIVEGLVAIASLATLAVDYMKERKQKQKKD